MRLASLLAAFTASIVAGCAPAPEPEPASPVRVQQPIIDGVPDLAPAHKAVVALVWGAGTGNFCSGTLIAPDVVVTAAHCVDTVSVGVLRVYFGNDVEAGGQYVTVSEVMPHPLYDSSAFVYDVGLVRLAEPAPADATPIPILPAGLDLSVADEGATVEFVGFGRTENGTSGQKLTADGIITRVCDGPGGCSWNSAPVSPRTIAYSMVDGGPCRGDSGGPAFLTRDGTEFVAAVTSYGDENCTFYGVSTRTDSYRAWIQAFIDGVTEDCATPGDEDLDGLADCADPDCDGDPACPPAACRNPEVLRCGDVVQDTTEGGSYAMRGYTCSGVELPLARGPERAYTVEAPVGLDVTVTLTPEAGVDLDLLQLPLFGLECATWDCLGASTRGPGEVDQLTFTVDSDDARLVVESVDTPGTYTLELQCHTSAERCDNRIDDDADGAVDCDDSDCAEDGACRPPPENCINGLDDDEDGAVDCDDSDCAASAACDQPKKKGGCQQGGAPTTPWSLLFVLLGLGALRRRRRQR